MYLVMRCHAGSRPTFFLHTVCTPISCTYLPARSTPVSRLGRRVDQPLWEGNRGYRAQRAHNNNNNTNTNNKEVESGSSISEYHTYGVYIHLHPRCGVYYLLPTVRMNTLYSYVGRGALEIYTYRRTDGRTDGMTVDPNLCLPPPRISYNHRLHM